VTALLEMASTPANQAPLAGNTLSTTGDYIPASYPGSQLKDGVITATSSTGWLGKVSSGAAATLTLGAATTVERIELTGNNANLPSSFVVEVKNPDNVTWRQVASGTNTDFAPNDNTTYRAIKSFAATSTTGVRVRFTGAVDTATGVVWLSEMQVWSTNASSTQRFDAWGNVASSTGSSIPTYGFAGREPDATGLVAMRARYYSPQLGRFISRDPAGLQSGISPYQYADGNPISNNDPTGLLANSVSNTVTNYAGQVGSWVSTHATNTAEAAVNSVLAGMPKTNAELATYGAGLNAAQNQGTAALGDFLRAPGNLPGSPIKDTVGLAVSLGAVTPAASALRSFADVVSGQAGIATPYGVATQSSTAAALAARAEVQNGASMYRIGTTGKSQAAEAQFWSLEHPLSPGYASRYGLPAGNVTNANFIEAAKIQPGTSFITRSAPGIGQNVGGGIEVVVPTGGVQMQWFTGMP